MALIWGSINSFQVPALNLAINSVKRTLSKAYLTHHFELSGPLTSVGLPGSGINNSIFFSLAYCNSLSIGSFQAWVERLNVPQWMGIINLPFRARCALEA